MEGKVFGIPLALILIIVGLAVFILIPVGLMMQGLNANVLRLSRQVENIAVMQRGLLTPTPTVTPVPSITLKPTLKSAVKGASTSGLTR